MLLGEAVDGHRRELHPVGELGVEPLEFPRELLDVLRPLEVRAGHTTGVGQDVGDDGDALRLEHRVAARGDGVVGRFEHHAGRHVGSVGGGDDLAHRRRSEEVALEREQLGVGDAIAVTGIDEEPTGVRVRLERRDVEAALVGDAARHVRHRHDLGAPLVQLPRHVPAYVAEPLDGDALADERQVVVLAERLEHVDASEAGGGLAAWGTAEGEGLARDHCRAVPEAVGVLVHDPRHDLGVGVDVGSGDVLVGPEDRTDHQCEAPGHALELVRAQLRRVHLDATLGPAERDVDQRRLPGHQRCEGANLVLVDARVVADAALVGATAVVVLHAEAADHAHRAVVEANGDLDRDLASRFAERDAHLARQFDDVRGGVDVEVDRLVGRGVVVTGVLGAHVVRRVTCRTARARAGRSPTTPTGRRDRDGRRRDADGRVRRRRPARSVPPRV